MKRFACAIITAGLLLSGCGYYDEQSSKECVKDKWTKQVSSDSGQKYLVGMQSGEVYEITDSLVKMRFDSANMFNKLTVGKCYKITYFGWRIPSMSEYRVILRAEEVK